MLAMVVQHTRTDNLNGKKPSEITKHGVPHFLYRWVACGRADLGWRQRAVEISEEWHRSTTC